LKGTYVKIIMMAIVFITFGVSASDLRLVILPKTTVDGKKYDAASVETEVIKRYTQKNMRIIELSTALKAQAAALSDLVAGGKVPKELSVLNADALVSAQLACDKNSNSIMGSKIKSWFCVFNTKIIRVDSGDVIFADSKNYTATGLNALQAMNTVVKKKVGKHADAAVDIWSKSWSNEGKWSLDLIITGIARKNRLNQINSVLKSVAGVKSSKVVMFKKNLSKIAISGEGSSNFDTLRDALDTSEKLSLQVNYDAGRVIHAEFDFGQAFSRGVSAYITPPKNATDKTIAKLIASKGSDLLQSYLMNLDYFEIESSAILNGKRKAAAAKAKSAGVPLVVFAQIAQKGKEWMSILELISTDNMKKLAVVKGTAGDPFEAMDKAVRNLDKKYRVSLTKPGFRKTLKFNKDVAGAVSSMKLSVEKFEVGQIFPSLVPYYRKKGIGSITVKNISSGMLKNVEIAYKINGKVVGTVKVADIAAKKTAKAQVQLDTVPDSKSEYSQLEANITFTVGDTYGKKDAFAPLVIHAKNAIDWSSPRTIASFVDPANKSVRDLATKALKNKIGKGLITKKLGNAALIYTALWNKPLKYMSDPVSTSFDANVDTVQFPAETLERNAGDCDDLTVLLASLFESVGLATVIITTPGHVFLGVESGALAGGNIIFNLPKSLFIEVDGALFIPVEATAIGSTFAQAWLKAADIVKKAGGSMSAFRTRDAWKVFPVTSVSSNKVSLKYSKPDTVKMKATIADVRKGSKEKAPTWAAEVYSGVTSSKSPKISAKKLGKAPIAKSVVLWMQGQRESAITESANLCSNGVVESCYNMTVMSMYDALERSDMQTIDANMNKNNYSEAVSMLPGNVISMLSDNGGLGMGDEASKESETKKKISDILRQARKKTSKKGKVKNSSRSIKTSHVGGRKASDKTKSDASATAEMFFWGRISK